jgi:hypothetical protein
MSPVPARESLAGQVLPGVWGTFWRCLRGWRDAQDRSAGCLLRCRVAPLTDAFWQSRANLPEMLTAFDTIDKLAGSAKLIVAGHDPQVADRFKPVEPGIIKIA